MAILKGKDKQNPATEQQAATQGKPKPGVADFVAGETKDFVADLQPYLPQELIGGSIPHIPGAEEEAVWNAASQACATERVHYAYTVSDNRCWYIACPSSSLASNPDTWCPLAAALPGNSEFWDRETVYLYEQEGMASALRWDPETGRMQIFLGASRTLLPRIQSMDANFATIDPSVATIVPWKNRQIRTEKLARGTARALVFSAILVNLIIVAIIIGQYVLTNYVERDLQKVKIQADKVATDLMIDAYGALQSDTIKHMVNVQKILDELSKIDGTLVRYEVDKNRLEWEALVPPSFANCRGALKGCKADETLEKDGRVRIHGTK